MSCLQHSASPRLPGLQSTRGLLSQPERARSGRGARPHICPVTAYGFWCLLADALYWIKLLYVLLFVITWLRSPNIEYYRMVLDPKHVVDGPRRLARLSYVCTWLADILLISKFFADVQLHLVFFCVLFCLLHYLMVTTLITINKRYCVARSHKWLPCDQ